MNTMDLFEVESPAYPADVLTSPIMLMRKDEPPEERATRRIQEVLRAGHPAGLMFSSGKDSATLVNLAINAAASMRERNEIVPPLFVIHSDTLVEQPYVRRLADAELKKIKAYAAKRGVNLTVKVGAPHLADTFPVRVIGGSGLPSFPDNGSACSVDWKVLPNERSLNEVIAEVGEGGRWKEPVIMTGVRQDESTARSIRIQKRNEVAEGIWKSDTGRLRASPILDFTLDMTWEYLAYCAAGVIPSYSDFEETMDFYRASGGSSCVIVADMKSQRNVKPCSSRTGCWSCVKVATDHSTEEMIASDTKKYGWLKPLNDLRNFISNTQYDWSRRQFVGRSISPEGDIEIGADTYSPMMLQDLLRYTLTAQVKTRYQIISYAQLVAIDARWSMYALCPPFTALKIYFDVVEDGNMYPAPTVQRFPKTNVPKIGRIHVGSPNWNAAMGSRATGLRDISSELFHESCGPDLRTLKDGSIVADLEVPGAFDIEEESAADFVTFFGREKIEEYCHGDCADWTYGYKTYLQYGTISVVKGCSHSNHKILQRSQWRQANQLHGQQDIATLASRCDFLYEQQSEIDFGPN